MTWTPPPVAIQNRKSKIHQAFPSERGQPVRHHTFRPFHPLRPFALKSQILKSDEKLSVAIGVLVELNGESPDEITDEQVVLELNTDFSTKGLSAQEITAIVAAWQANAISRDTMTELFRGGEVLPEGRSAEEETTLISGEKAATPPFELKALPTEG